MNPNPANESSHSHSPSRFLILAAFEFSFDGCPDTSPDLPRPDEGARQGCQQLEWLISSDHLTDSNKSERLDETCIGNVARYSHSDQRSSANWEVAPLAFPLGLKKVSRLHGRLHQQVKACQRDESKFRGRVREKLVLGLTQDTLAYGRPETTPD